MKLNKLVIAMGLASVALTACNSDSGTAPAPKADFTVTAIDGYIVNGLVTATCGDKVYQDRTDAKGVAELVAEGNKIEDCTAVITGDENTHDADAPAVAWTHTMKTLPGLAVINPFTDVAVTLSKLPENKDKSVEELKNAVLETLGYTDNDASSAILFGDFAADTASEGDKEVAYLATAVFAAKVQLVKTLEKADKANNTPANLAALYNVILKKVEKETSKQIQDIKDAGGDVSKNVAVVTIPEFEVNFTDGKVDTTGAEKAAVKVESKEKGKVEPKPEPTTGATGATGATGGTTIDNNGGN